MSDVAAPKPKRAAGRDLSAAIGVGVALGGSVILGLTVARPLFLVTVLLAVAIAVHELGTALRAGGFHPPLAPLVVGGPLVPLFGWWKSPHDGTVAFLCLLLAVVVWRVGEDLVRRQPFTGDAHVTKDIAAGVLAAVYVPYMASFVTIVLAQPDGDRQILTWLGCVVFSDVGGYAVGVLTRGRHKMVPLISPGKSWEGLAGSLVFASVWGVIFMSQVLHEHAWKGIVLGVAMALSAVVGDLVESVFKRDLGIKDMGQLLPGHGGLMDRIDSILVAAPVAWAVLAVLLS